jgi:hypothetical protein
MINYTRAHKGSVRKCEGKRPLGGSSDRWKNNIKTELEETGWKSVD